MKYLSNQTFQCPISTPSLQITGGSSTDGIFTWNSADETINVTLGASTGQLFEEEYIHVKNSSGSLIPDRTAVRKVGTDGMSGHILIAPMIADGTVSPNDFLGITTNDIANGGFGKVTTFGKINGVNTSIWPDNTDLWLDPAVPGGFTSTKPTAPNLKINPAYVIASHAVNGKIFVRVNAGTDLHNNHRVHILSPDANGNPQVDGQLLRWNDTLNRWENWTSNYLTTSNVSGTTNYISKFTGTNTLGNSQIYDDGTNVGIGTSTPSQKFVVSNGSSEVFKVYGGGEVVAVTNYIYAAYSSGTSFYAQGPASFRNGIHNDTNTYLKIDGGTSGFTYFSGNVGIGTTSPTARLHISGSTDATQRIIVDGSGSNSSLHLNYNGSNVGFINSYQNSELNIGTSVSAFVNFYTNNTERMRITAAGNVGIGTSSPTRKLDVAGDMTLTTGGYIYGDSTNPYLNLSQTTGTLLAYGSTSQLYLAGSVTTLSAGSNYLGLITNGSERLRITSTGNVLIGTTTDSGYKLYVNGTGYFADNIKLQTGILSFDGVAGYWGNAIKYEAGQLNLYQSGDLHLGVGGSNITLYKDTKIPHNQRFTAGGYSSTDGITIWGTQNASAGGDGFVGRNLYYNGTNYIYASTNDSNLWGTIAGMRVVGSGSNALEFIARPATNSGLNVVASDLDSYKRMVISYSGNVGIGTTSPNYKLDVAGSINIYTGNSLRWGSGDVEILNSGYNLLFSTYTGSALTEKMRITSAGNVGIGITSPSQILHIYGGAPTPMIESTTVGANANLRFKTTARTWSIGPNQGLSNSFFEIYDSTANATRVTIDTSGNVGIGTTSPGRKLDINTDGGLGNANNYLRLSASAAGAYSFNSYIEGYYNDYGNGEVARIGLIHFEGTRPGANNVGGNIKFYTKTLGGLNTADPTVKMTITADGNVGVGTTSPTYKLDVVGTFRTSGQSDFLGNTGSGHVMARFNDNGTLMRFNTFAIDNATGNAGQQANLAVGSTYSTLARLFVKGTGSTSATTALLVQNSSASNLLAVLDNGNVGIGTAAPTNALSIAGNGTINFVGASTITTPSAYGFVMNAGNVNIYHTNSGLSLQNSFWFGGGANVADNVSATQTNTNPASNGSAVFQISSTRYGFLQPRMTNTQVNAISTPATGLQAYDTTNNKNMLYNGSSWQSIATESYVNTQITNLINGAPAALDTLNELSAALGNDANFATTVTNSLASKVPNTRTLTINGTTYDLSANRSWTVSSDLQSAVNTSKVTTPVNPGANVVASFSVASYDGATFNYVLKDGTNFRAGTVVAVWNGATVQYNETTTNDIGNTTSVVLSVAISAGNAELIATSGTPGWTMKVVPIGI